jgi:hypothetical protein
MVPVGLWKGGENEFAALLGAQWPSRRRPSGAAALAVALLESAARDAGLTATGAKHIRPRQRATARAYLAGRTDGSEAVPLEIACGLAGLDVDRVRRAVRQRLGAAP